MARLVYYDPEHQGRPPQDEEERTAVAELERCEQAQVDRVEAAPGCQRRIHVNNEIAWRRNCYCSRDRGHPGDHVTVTGGPITTNDAYRVLARWRHCHYDQRDIDHPYTAPSVTP